MEMFDILMRLVDLPAVMLAIVITQCLRYFLPSPPGGGKFDVHPIIHRLLPIIPLIIATLVVIIKDGIFTPTMKLDDAIIKGVLSGAASSYMYRTTKVMFFPDKPSEPGPSTLEKPNKPEGGEVKK